MARTSCRGSRWRGRQGASGPRRRARGRRPRRRRRWARSRRWLAVAPGHDERDGALQRSGVAGRSSRRRRTGRPVAIRCNGSSLTYADVQAEVFRAQHALAGSTSAEGERVVLVVNDEPAFPAWFLGALRAGVVPVPAVDDAHRRRPRPRSSPTPARRRRRAVGRLRRLRRRDGRGRPPSCATPSSSATASGARPSRPTPGRLRRAHRGRPVATSERLARVLAVQLGHDRSCPRASCTATAACRRPPTPTPGGARDRSRRPVPVGGQAVLRLRPRQLPDVPALGRRLRHPQPAPPDAGRRRRARQADARRCSSPAPASSPPCSTPTCPADTFASRAGHGHGGRVPAGRAAAAVQRAASATRCSTASARPRRCTSSSPTRRRRAAGHERVAGAGLRGHACSTTPAAWSTAADTPGLPRTSRGPSLATGYWQRPDATAAAFHGDGWLRTGDVYTRSDDGYWTFLGRNSDMIKAGGIWVSPAEVEAVLIEHPDVLEAAVVGDRDGGGLETTVAFVVARAGATIDAADDRRALPAQHGGVQAAAPRRGRRRAAEDGDRQDPPLRPARAAGGGALSRRRSSIGRRRTLDVGVDAGGGPAGGAAAAGVPPRGARIDRAVADRSPTPCAPPPADPASSSTRAHGYGRSGPGRAAAAGQLHARRGRRRAAGAARRASASSGPVLVGHSDGASIALLTPAAAIRRRRPRAARPARVRRGRSVAAIAGAREAYDDDRPAGAHGPPPRRRRRHVPRLERRVAVAGVPVVEHRGPPRRDHVPGAARAGRRRPVRQPRPARRHRARRAGPVTRLVLPGVGHAPHLEAPDATLAAVAAFVNAF